MAGSSQKWQEGAGVALTDHMPESMKRVTHDVPL
jgi:hypothetical protein